MPASRVNRANSSQVARFPNMTRPSLDNKLRVIRVGKVVFEFKCFFVHKDGKVRVVVARWDVRNERPVGWKVPVHDQEERMTGVEAVDAAREATRREHVSSTSCLSSLFPR